MSTKAGQLLWNRMQIDITSIEGGTPIDTGLTQINKGFAADSVNEPSLGTSGIAPPFPGTGAPSRVQVIPMAPLDKWNGVTHSEPYFNTVTKTVHVQFYSLNPVQDLNVLFWDPHSAIGPGEAKTYNGQILV